MIEMIVIAFAIYGVGRLVLDLVDTIWPLR
jgi:hypothetical protein